MKTIFGIKASNRVSLVLLVATVLLVFTLPFLEDFIESESSPDALQETFRFLFPLLFAMGALWVLATLYLQFAYTWQITRGLVPRPRLKALSGLFFLSLFICAAAAFLLIIDNGLTAKGDLATAAGPEYSELFVEADNGAGCGLMKISPIRSLVGAIVPEDAAGDDTADDLIRLDLTYFLLDQTFKGLFFDTAEIFNCNLGTLSYNPDNLAFTISLAAYRALVSLTFATFFLAIVFGGKAQSMRP